MASMQKLDSTFNILNKKLSLTGVYDSANINFECLRETIDSYEQKCGKFSDYGLSFVKHFAEACERYQSV